MSTAFVVFSLVENRLAVKSRWPMLLVNEWSGFRAMSVPACRWPGAAGE